MRGGPNISASPQSLTAGLSERLTFMSMQAESLEVLEKAAVAPTQARAIVRAIEIEIAARRIR